MGSEMCIRDRCLSLLNNERFSCGLPEGSSLLVEAWLAAGLAERFVGISLGPIAMESCRFVELSAFENGDGSSPLALFRCRCKGFLWCVLPIVCTELILAMVLVVDNRRCMLGARSKVVAIGSSLIGASPNAWISYACISRQERPARAKDRVTPTFGS